MPTSSSQRRPAKGEHHLDALVLAALNAAAYASAATRGGVAVACKVDLRGLATAKVIEECNVYVGVSESGTCTGEGTFIAVLAPVNGDPTSMRGSDEI
ncbi:hypothetical protein NL676_000311 [Syzygium grande]|nr:hypothetical protein NL676_000311 [Syzygium grande]